MGKPTKKKRAAQQRELAKRLARLSKADFLPPLEMFPGLKPEPKLEVESTVEGDPPFPLEPTVIVAVKQESVYTGPSESKFTLQDEVEVKEELLDPENSGLVVDASELDPIAGQPLLEMLQSTTDEMVEPEDDRCQFCYKLFQEAGGRGAITKVKIEYVLGLTNWETPGRRPSCCEECRKMFDMFYEFKQGCLVALARPLELLKWTEVKGLVDFKPKSTKSKQIRKRTNQKSTVVRVKVVGAKPKRQRSKKTPKPSASAGLQDAKEAECAVCQEKVPNGLALSKHMKKKHYPAESDESNEAVKKEKKKYCGHCRKWFSDKELYTQHKPECIENYKRNRPPPPEFPCSLCPKKFSREKDLGFHMNMHNGVRTLACRREGCTKMFYHPNIRHNHETLCGQEITVICSMCAAVFRSKSALRIHMASHGDPQFMCEICNKGFYTKANLKKHASAHSDERRFQCKVCGKRFKSHEANRVHQRIHTDEKPYVCHICGQRFTYNCMLKTHMEKGHDFIPPEQPAAMPASLPVAPKLPVFVPNPFGGFGF